MDFAINSFWISIISCVISFIALGVNIYFNYLRERSKIRVSITPSITYENQLAQKYLSLRVTNYSSYDKYIECISFKIPLKKKCFYVGQIISERLPFVLQRDESKLINIKLDVFRYEIVRLNIKDNQFIFIVNDSISRTYKSNKLNLRSFSD